LENEIREMEVTFGRAPRHNPGAGSGSAKLDHIYTKATQPTPDSDPFMMQQNSYIKLRREQLIADARRTQLEIQKLQMETENLHQQTMGPSAYMNRPMT